MEYARRRRWSADVGIVDGWRIHGGRRFWRAVRLIRRPADPPCNPYGRQPAVHVSDDRPTGEREKCSAANILQAASCIVRGQIGDACVINDAMHTRPPPPCCGPVLPPPPPCRGSPAIPAAALYIFKINI